MLAGVCVIVVQGVLNDKNDKHDFGLGLWEGFEETSLGGDGSSVIACWLSKEKSSLTKRKLQEDLEMVVCTDLQIADGEGALITKRLIRHGQAFRMEGSFWCE